MKYINSKTSILIIGAFLLALIITGCSNNNVPAGSDASKLPVNTTSNSQLMLEASRHNQIKNYYRKAALTRRHPSP